MPLPWPSRGLGLTLLALVACAPPHVTVVPEALQGCAPLEVQVDPHLFAVTERWASGGTAGEVAVGEWLRQVLVDEPQAPLRLTYVTSQLHVATVVSPVFYRPRAYEARYQLVVRVETPTTGTRQAWLHAAGDGRTLVSAARAATDAITQAVRELCRHVAAWREAGGPRAESPMSQLDRGEGMDARVRKPSRAAVGPGISCGSRVGYAASLGGISSCVMPGQRAQGRESWSSIQEGNPLRRNQIGRAAYLGSLSGSLRAYPKSDGPDILGSLH